MTALGSATSSVALLGALAMGWSSLRRPRPRRPEAAVGWAPSPHRRAGSDAWVRRGSTSPALVAASVVGGALLVGPIAPLAVAAGVGLVRWWRPRRAAGRGRADALADELPDVADLLSLAVGAGFTVRLAAEAVARHGTGSVADAFAVSLEQVGRGARLADELETMRSLGPAVEPLLDALLATERYGTPLGPALERIAADGRADRRRRLEEEARKVPVRLLFPLVVCILPSVGLLTVVPVAGAALDGLTIPAP